MTLAQQLETGEWTLSAERVKTGSKTGEGRSFIISPTALSRLRARSLRMAGSSAWIFGFHADGLKRIKENFGASERKGEGDLGEFFVLRR